LGFQTVDPLGPVESVRFRLWVKSIDKVEAIGRLVWIDETGKRGGLQFVHLPEEVREQIRAWLEESYLSEDGAQASLALGADNAAPSLPDGGSTDLSDDAGSSASEAETVGGHILDESADVGPGIASRPRFQSVPTAGGEHGLRGLALTAGLVFMALIGSFSYTYRGHVGHLLITLGEKMSGDNQEQSVAPTAAALSSGDTDFALNDEKAASDSAARPTPGATDSTTLEASFSAKNPKGGSPDASVASPDSGAKADMRGDAFTAQDDGDAQLALARGYLQSGNDPEQTAKAVQLLWSAVEKRNVGAETMLADVYLRGEGVPKSCEQARILLTAASKSDSSAKQKLLELGSFDCQPEEDKP
jgi:hypothetical protein